MPALSKVAGRNVTRLSTRGAAAGTSALLPPARTSRTSGLGSRTEGVYAGAARWSDSCAGTMRAESGRAGERRSGVPTDVNDKGLELPLHPLRDSGRGCGHGCGRGCGRDRGHSQICLAFEAFSKAAS